MAQPNYHQLLSQVMDSNPAQQMAARMIILAMEEDAVNALIDIYYAGVTDAEGEAILEIIAEIGGYEAVLILRNIYDFEDSRPQLRHSAAKGLLRNSDSLTQEEREDIAMYFARLG